MRALLSLALLAAPVPLHAATASARVTATIAVPASIRTDARARTVVRADAVHQRRVDGRAQRARHGDSHAKFLSGSPRSLILDFE